MFTLNPSYVTDGKNKKIAVQLNIKTYKKIEEILENYSLYKLMLEADEGEKLNLAEAKAYYKKLKKAK